MHLSGFAALICVNVPLTLLAQLIEKIRIGPQPEDDIQGRHLSCSASDCRGFDRFAADHRQARQHGEPKGQTAQNKCGSKARLEASAHEMKKPRAGSFKGAKTERNGGQGSNHGGKYEAIKVLPTLT